VAVLIDSSVWIAAQNSKNAECLDLKRMIADNELIYTAKPIQIEVCQGARSEELFNRIWDSFLGFDFLEIEDRHWWVSARNYFRCRKAGLTVSTIDCLIATLAREYEVPLWTLDRHFDKIQKILGFELFRGRA
jgi:predicted nucleic acid-binding protein